MNAQLPMSISAPFTRAEKTAIRNLVRRAVRAEILPRFRKLDANQIATKSGPTDLVTDADTNAEALITRGLQMAFPSALIVGEEAVAKSPELLDKLPEAELSFLIDPVDGTWNFANGLPLYGTILAACRFARPVYGLIHDPMGDDSMEADTETTARHVLPGRIKSLTTRPGSDAGELSGYASLNLLDADEKQRIFNRLSDTHLLSTLRCSAHEYRMLAQGSVDFVLGVRMTPWDHAAGVLLCQQAGGHVAMLDGRDYTAAEQGYLLAAGSKATWDAIASRLA